MSTYFGPLPSHETMQFHCHSNHYRSLAMQACSLAIVFTILFFILSSIPEVLARILTFITDMDLGSGNPESLQDYLVSTLLYASATAAIVVALAVFARTYLRSQHGAPAYYSELEIDLPQEGVEAMCRNYMREHTVDHTLFVDHRRDRMIGLMGETRLASTYLEVTSLALEENRTWIVARGASITEGHAAILSTFYNDLGASRTNVNDFMDIFSPYASRQRRTYPGSSRKQAIELVRPIDDCPPPLLAKVRQFG